MMVGPRALGEVVVAGQLARVQGCEVHHLKVAVDADLSQLLADVRHHVNVPGPGVDQEALGERNAVGVARVCDELAGPVLVLSPASRVEAGKLPDLSVRQREVPEVPGVQDVPGDAPEGRVPVAGARRQRPVDGVVQRRPHPVVVEGRLAGVDDQVVPHAGVDLPHVHLVAKLVLDALGLDLLDDRPMLVRVQVPRQHQGQRRRLLRDHRAVHRVHVR